VVWTESGKAYMLKRMSDNVRDYITHIAIGTSTPDFTNDTLGNEVARTAISDIEVVDDKTYKFIASFPPETPNYDIEVSELGLIADGYKTTGVFIDIISLTTPQTKTVENTLIVHYVVSVP